MNFKPIEAFAGIKPGDLVRVATGALAGSTQIVRRVSRSLNTFSPICGWYGGPAIVFEIAPDRFRRSATTVHHFMLDQEQPVQVSGWVTPEDLEADIERDQAQGRTKYFIAFGDRRPSMWNKAVSKAWDATKAKHGGTVPVTIKHATTGAVLKVVNYTTKRHPAIRVLVLATRGPDGRITGSKLQFERTIKG